MSGAGVDWALGTSGMVTPVVRLATAALSEPSTCDLCILSCLSLQLFYYDSLNLLQFVKFCVFLQIRRCLELEEEYLTGVLASSIHCSPLCS